MGQHAYQTLIKIISNHARPIEKSQYANLFEKIGDARFVLIGESTHGTHEFYETRIAITRYLIENKGFMAVAIEGDWPDAYQVNRYIKGESEVDHWEKALQNFTRFPKWMWRNTTIPPFLKWLRDYNDHIPNMHHKVGFYGLDLYSLHTSMHAVIKYLLKVDPVEAEKARLRYACFDNVKLNPEMYGYLTTTGVKKPCLEDAIKQLLVLQNHSSEYIKNTLSESSSADDYFYAVQNARLVKNAEHYYRSMFEGHIASWNVRDRHMTETFNILAAHLEEQFNKPAKIIVWAHNSHVGDARATEMGEMGEVNIGQLIREEHNHNAYLIGFSTHNGTVTAATNWDEPTETKQVIPGLKGSYEDLFHHVKPNNFLLNLRGNPELHHYLNLSRLQRAIGVIYRPDTERESHYFFTHLPYQFDSIIHIDKTSAVKPLD